MANYYATTVSEGGKVKKGSEKKILEIISKYSFGTEGNLNVGIDRSSGELEIYGDDSAYAYHADDEDRDEEAIDHFLGEIARYIKTPLVVKEVGNEKCRYVCAYAYIVRPYKKGEQVVFSVSLDEAVQKIINKK